MKWNKSMQSIFSEKTKHVVLLLVVEHIVCKLNKIELKNTTFGRLFNALLILLN